MANIYLQIEFKTGNIFQYSKNEQEGFEPHTNTKDTVSYRKYYNKGLYGILKSTSVRTSNFGDEISIAMVDNSGNNIYLTTPLFSQNGGIATYAESFIRVVGKLEIGKQYRIYPYAIQEDGQKYAKYGISIKEADIEAETVVDEKLPLLSYSYTPKGKDSVKGDIPEVLWTKKMGKNVKNTDDKDNYLYEVLIANSKDDRKDSEGTKEDSTPQMAYKQEEKEEPTKEVPKKPVTKADLPF